MEVNTIAEEKENITDWNAAFVTALTNGNIEVVREYLQKVPTHSPTHLLTHSLTQRVIAMWTAVLPRRIQLH